MAYRGNYGTTYPNYNPENSLGHSNSSKYHNKHSFRSTILPIQMAMKTKGLSAKSSSCWRTSAKSSEK